MKNTLVLYLIGFFAHLISSQKKSVPSESNHPAHKPDTYSLDIMRSLEYIKLHFHEKFTVNQLAAQLNMSRSTYLRHFSTMCGCSPLRYKITCQIKKASELLKFTDMSLSAIAQECGFYDSSHFTRIYTADTGKSPLYVR